jgi:hydroxymethylpyrimidine/phosphomethylpyrimidine kinase
MTALTAQNTRRVTMVETVSPAMAAPQLGQGHGPMGHAALSTYQSPVSSA